MAAPYTKAQLHAEILAAISSMTAPESITPTSLGQVLDDIVDSFWNLLDNPGLDNPNANSQGLPGEFVACVADCALQTQNGSLSEVADTFLTPLFFPDDSDNGSFDNGNNWLLTKYVTPASGFVGKLTLVGGAIKMLSGSVSTGGVSSFKVKIIKNRLTAPVVLATGGTLAFFDTSSIGDIKSIYLLAAGTDASPISLVSGDIIEVGLYVGDNGMINSDESTFQISSGLFTAQKV